MCQDNIVSLVKRNHPEGGKKGYVFIKIGRLKKKLCEESPDLSYLSQKAAVTKLDQFGSSLHCVMR